MGRLLAREHGGHVLADVDPLGVHIVDAVLKDEGRRSLVLVEERLLVRRPLGLDASEVYRLREGIVVDVVLQVIRLREEGEVLLGLRDVRPLRVDEIGRACRVRREQLVVEDREGEEAEARRLDVRVGGMDGARFGKTIDRHRELPAGHLLFGVGELVGQRAGTEVTLLVQLVDLGHGRVGGRVAGEGRLVGVELGVEARLELLHPGTDLREPQDVMPSVADRLVDRGDAGGLDLGAIGHEIVVRRRDAGDPRLLEDVLVVDDDPIPAVDVPDFLAIHLAVDGRLGNSGRIFPLHPLFVRQIDGVRLNIVVDLQVGHAALTAEDVRPLARVELGFEYLEVVGGRDDLVVDVDASLSLELLGEIPHGIMDPALALKHRQGDFG